MRRRATEVLFRRIQDISRRFRFDRDILEDAASAVTCRMIEAGPRGVRDQDPPNDEAVGWFLRACIRNEALTQIRRRNPQRVVTVERLDDLPGPILMPDFDKDDASRALEKARQGLFDVVVPEVASRLREAAGQRFTGAIENRRAIVEGRRSCDDCVRLAFGVVNKQTRNRFDQSQSRALKRLGDGVENHIVQRNLSPTEAYALRIVLDALKKREASWPTEETSS